MQTYQRLYLGETVAARRRVYLRCTDPTDGHTPEVGEAAGQPQLSKNGAAAANTSATLTAVDATNGVYYVELTEAELDTVGTYAVIYASASSEALALVSVEPAGLRGIVTGKAIAGTLSTTQMTTDLTEATDDHYNGRTVVWLTGVLTGQAQAISDYTGASKTVTYGTATDTPSAGDQFIIV